MELLIIVLIYAAIGYYFFQRHKDKEQARKDRAAKWGRAGPPPSHHCMTCGHDYAPNAEGPQRGNIYIEVAIWLVFFPAGIVYSIWRRNTGAGKPVCPMCQGYGIPIDTPAARAHIKQLASE